MKQAMPIGNKSAHDHQQFITLITQDKKVHKKELTHITPSHFIHVYIHIMRSNKRDKDKVRINE